MTTIRILNRKHEGTGARYFGGVPTVAKGDRRMSPEGLHGRWLTAVVEYPDGCGRSHEIETNAPYLPDRMREANWCRDDDPGPPESPSVGIDEALRAKWREKKRRQREGKRGPVIPCVDCGMDIVEYRRGPPSVRCVPCRAEYRKRTNRARALAYHHAKRRASA